MDRDILWKIFSLSYCNTCHSGQGCNIDDAITIFDCNTPYVNRNWLYTAITRARDLSKVYVYIHNEKDIRTLESCKWKHTLTTR